MYNETQCGSCEYHDGVFLCSGCPAVPKHREHPDSVRCMWYTSRLPVAAEAASVTASEGDDTDRRPAEHDG